MKPFALLIAPPVYDFALYDLFLKPFGLLRIAKWLKDSGYSVKVINALDYKDAKSILVFGKPKRKKDGTGKFFREVIKKPPVLEGVKRRYSRYGILIDELRKRIAEQKPDIILVASGMTYWYPGVIEVVRICRGYFPGIPIVVGGIYATLCREHAEKNLDVDYIVSGNAYPALKNILERSGLPLLKYKRWINPMIHEDFYTDSAVIVLNEGCPFKCSYCASSLFYEHFAKGSVESTFELLATIRKILGTTNFAFYDDALLFRKEEVLIPFLERVVDSNLNIKFYVPNGIHLAFLDYKTAELMKKSGFKEVRIGLESSSAVFHRENDMKLDMKVFPDKIAMLKEVGFSGSEIGVYLLAGLPGQKWNEVYESIRYVSRFGVKIYVAEYSPVPGTPMFERAVTLSSFPLREEPLTHNNSIFPMQWSGFTLKDMERLKNLSREMSVDTSV